MLKITSKEIREIFLNFFVNKKHLKIPCSSIIPTNDPTLLFINSGMAPLKKYFTGEAQPPNSDLCNIQPCIRTIDIEEVGDRHHLTSFEMLGSWSINNYFKEKAIALAFELLVEGFKIPKEKLYVTVFEGCEKLNLSPDYESARAWEKLGIPKSHIVFQPFEDNFWGPAGETGPCGPCTEVFYDTGDEHGEAYVEGGYFDTKNRYIEIWNAGVFMQFNKNLDGTYTPLKFKSVDTGAGLERLTMVLNGLDSVYETDLLKPIMDEIALQSKGNLSQKAMRIIADHLRTTSFILSEGIKPSNDGRGYIPRRLIRKCAALTLKAKVEEFDFVSVLEKVIGQYSDFYTHFKQNKEDIINTFENERTHFQQVLKDGFKRLEKITGKESFEISGKDAFILVSTYGIPIELIQEYAEEKGGNVNIDEYKEEFKKHQEISKSPSSGGGKEGGGIDLKELEGVLKDIPQTQFKGYEVYECEGTVLRIIKNGEKTDSVKSGDKALIITDRTPFYAESGGQVPDIGEFITPDGKADVLDVQKDDNGVFVHLVVVKEGILKVNSTVEMKIDKERRLKIQANHSSVHLLQSALRKLLGNTISQTGSLVEEDRLRFDFQYDDRMTEEEIEQVEKQVNKYIQMNIPLTTEITTLNDAIQKGVLAFFGDKYGDSVRVVQFGEISKELCGGTHTSATGNIGCFKILSEGSVGRGIRRITAVTGNTAIEYTQNQIKILKEVASKLRVSPENVASKLDTLLKAPKKKDTIEFKPLDKSDIQENTKTSGSGQKYFVKIFDGFSDEIRDEAIRISEIIKGIVCFICKVEDKLRVIVAVDKPLSKKYNANLVIKNALKHIDGKGGGKPHLALGGGVYTENYKNIIEEFDKIIDSI
ncbi:alanine--tRNA ligase [Acetivibrio saccincola]|uniref:alanine--tRNA ligase n=1 Tax=Acetivibrio saccincola TaxID=1677857 RepID=UPI000A7D076F|nr:alanine--tRNA ligase [Acetivibrio saccincola]NLW27410.1 alanine--tRNA ligase [Acetivibrio saccincola]HOA97413.1 alanine--tRNA ligase [Acetivibrio saccincola]HQD29551.1 alanine--tRNA ligase [Acetivibrio saccincola]